jgi:hypothetical protein
MNPFASALGIGGLGLELFGGLSAASDARHIADKEMQVAQNQLQEDNVRRQAMELTAQRQMVEDVRGAQARRAGVVSASVGSGAQFSSSRMGAESSVLSAAGKNIQGTSENLQFGEQMFTLDQYQDILKMDIAKLQGKQSSDQGLASIGAGMMGAGKMFSS